MRVEMQQALDKIGETYGMAFEIGRITFDDNSIKTSVEAVLTSAPGESKMAVDFRKKRSGRK
jgi:hypothetical protein